MSEADDPLSTGIPELDDDHNALHDLYQSLVRSLAEERDVAEFALRFEELLDRTREHFEREERFMRDNDFPGFAAHKVEHRRLERDAADFLHSVSTRYDSYDCPAVARYFWHWLTDHIAKHDRAIVTFIRQRRGS